MTTAILNNAKGFDTTSVVLLLGITWATYGLYCTIIVYIHGKHVNIVLVSCCDETDPKLA